MEGTRAQRKGKRNDIIIGGWKALIRESLEKAVEELFQKEMEAEIKIDKAFWTKRGANMITARMRNREEIRLQGTSIFIDNDLTLGRKRNTEKSTFNCTRGKNKRSIGENRIQKNSNKRAVFQMDRRRTAERKKFLEQTELHKSVNYGTAEQAEV